NSTCHLEEPDLLTKCPGPSFKFKTGASKTLQFGGNYLVGASFEGSCIPTSSSQNMVYSISSEYAATMHLELRNDRGAVLMYVRSECAGGPLTIGAPPDLGCLMGGGPGHPVTLDIPVVPGRAYSVFLDSGIVFEAPDAGPYTLDITMVEPKCGN